MLTWTKETPTAVGWYWKRHTQFPIEEIVQVRNYAGDLAIGNTHLTSPVFSHHEWAGPIKEPLD